MKIIVTKKVSSGNKTTEMSAEVEFEEGVSPDGGVAWMPDGSIDEDRAMRNRARQLFASLDERAITSNEIQP